MLRKGVFYTGGYKEDRAEVEVMGYEWGYGKKLELVREIWGTIELAACISELVVLFLLVLFMKKCMTERNKI